MLVAVVPLGSAKTPVELVLIVALPEVEPFSTTLPPVPPFTPSVALLVPVIVVNAAVPGVVPPIAPGAGKEEVEPPRETDVPPIVIAEFASAVFGIALKEIAPVDAMLTPPLPLNPALPTLPIGIADSEIAPVDAMDTPPLPLSPALPTAPMGSWPLTSEANATGEDVTVCVEPAK
jgi:hypothetical protein